MQQTQQSSAPIETVTGQDFATALKAAAANVENHAEAINALNVFPVPDGDTGTNMSLTLRAAAEGARKATGDSIGDVAAQAARGALMGARGNSGVILAEWLRGVARALAGHTSGDARTLAEALRSGADSAYAAVTNPVEGTILTVAREAAAEAQTAARTSRDIAGVLDRAHTIARLAVARTPDQLPVLKQAGVVDSGAEGYRALLEALAAYFRGDQPSTAPVPIHARADLAALHDENDTYGYCTEVLFEGPDVDIEALRQRLSTLGTSVLVVGDPTLLKVHVHTLRPGQVLDLATEHGEILNVKVDNIQRQRREMFAGDPSDAPVPELGTAVVAIASGAGFVKIFESLNATVVDGGESMNASVEDILEAIDRAPRTDVLVLPNDRNAVLASEAAGRLAEGRTVRVVATHTVPQGIAAALTANPDGRAETNLQAVVDAAARCQTIALTRAARDATVDDVRVSVGQIFGTLNGRAVGGGATIQQVLGSALDALPPSSYEIATVYVGRGGTETEAAKLAAILTQRLSVQADIVSGEQPHYEYIISIE